jgi:acyl-CoA hydrolase
VASAIIEIVTPLFRKRLQKYIQSRGFGSLQDFINDPSVRHVLFHLRHRNTS